MLIYQQDGMEAKTDWTNNSSEMERKRNRASYEDKRQSGVNNIILLVAMRFWETPVHIPNTMVKTKAADDTILVTVWESRWLPDQKKNNNTSWGRSSVGRAPALQAGGQEFESLRLQSKSKDFMNKDCTLKTSYRDKY